MSSSLLFTVYVALILLLIIYLILGEYFSSRIRRTLRDNTNTQTSISPIDALKNRIECDKRRIYCANDNDCLELCTRAIDDITQVEYKCNDINICTQSTLINGDETTSSLLCNRDFGFIPILTADEIFQPHWVCLNTRPNVFDNRQQYHSFICAGGNRSSLDPDRLFDSCLCPPATIKIHDEFRPGLPICVDKHQLPLFPNFTIKNDDEP